MKAKQGNYSDIVDRKSRDNTGNHKPPTAKSIAHGPYAKPTGGGGKCLGLQDSDPVRLSITSKKLRKNIGDFVMTYYL